jgi:hypothetical protein
MKFKLEVYKLKCIPCDLIFLVENLEHYHSSWFTCPQCNGSEVHDIHNFGTIIISEEEVIE